MSYKTPPDAYRQAVANIGGPSAAAIVQKCSVANVSQLLKRGSACPAGSAIAIAEKSGIPRSALRPDLYPGEDI